MRLLLQTHCTDSFDDPCEMTHVLVDIDPRHQLDMRARLSDVLTMPQIYAVTFFDPTLEPVLCEFYDEMPEWFHEDAELQTIPDDAAPPAADLRIDVATIRYMPDGLMWHFYEKHGGDPYETATIPWPAIQAAAKQKGAGRAQISH